MYRVRIPFLLSAGAILLLGADPFWKTKPIPSWTTEDAQQILTESPWAKINIAGIARLQSEDERRAGGEMGQATGVGFDGINNGKKPMPNMSSIVGGPNANPKRTGADTFEKLKVVWESALPVHVAELKSHDIEPPTLSGDGYTIAVYQIPNATLKGDPKKLGDPLKHDAVLRREGKPDVRAISAEVFPREDGIVVTYRFPLSAELTKKDGTVTFQAQIGRLIVQQVFFLEEMLIQGKLEL
jgi:hypothetical protein